MVQVPSALARTGPHRPSTRKEIAKHQSEELKGRRNISDDKENPAIELDKELSPKKKQKQTSQELQLVELENGRGALKRTIDPEECPAYMRR